MKLGAQLFSLRTLTQTAEGLRGVMEQCRDIGYENVQLSAIGPIPAEEIRRIVDDTGMKAVVTHTPLDRIVGDTARVIEEHKLFGCPVIGLGALPPECRGTRAGAEEMLRRLEEPVRRIEDAGLRFGYHNHAFEFTPFTDGDGNTMEFLLNECPTWAFTFDIYWAEFAGQSAVEWLRKIGRERLPNVHLKDMSRADTRDICACGEGRFDLRAICAACEENGVKNLLVEQDNAVAAPDPVGQMAISYKTLRPLIAREDPS